MKNIRRAIRKQYSAEEKIRVVLDGLRGEHSIAELCRREGIAESLYYSWSKEFLETGKRRFSGDTARAATSSEVKHLRRQAQEPNEVVAEQALELRLLKNVWSAPSARVKFGCPVGSASTYPVSGLPRLRWRSVQSGPHKHVGHNGHFFNQAAGSQELTFRPSVLHLSQTSRGDR